MYICYEILDISNQNYAIFKQYFFYLLPDYHFSVFYYAYFLYSVTNVHFHPKTLELQVKPLLRKQTRLKTYVFSLVFEFQFIVLVHFLKACFTQTAIPSQIIQARSRACEALFFCLGFFCLFGCLFKLISNCFNLSFIHLIFLISRKISHWI